MSDPSADRAWSWVTHLRAGGRTPWADWPSPPATPGEQVAPVPSGPTGPRVLPGAQQLELLRRVNAVGDLPVHVRDRILTASAVDRGRTDLPLPGGPRRTFGPAPLDPADVPAEDLLRVAVLLLADALPEVPGPPVEVAAPTRGARLLRVARDGYRVVGDPWLAALARDELRRRGRPPGGRRPRVLVLGGPVPDLLARTWTHRVLTEGAPPWPTWIADQAGGALPRGADVAGEAETWAARVGRSRVVVVTDPAALGRLAGVRRLDLAQALGSRAVGGAPGGLGGDAVDLVRRVRLALAVVAPPRDHTDLLRDRLLPALSAVADRAAVAGRDEVVHLVAGPPARVPTEHARWVARRAGRQRHRVLQAGYAVAGDVDDLLPSRPGAAPDGPGRDVPDPEQVLEVAVLLLAQGLVPGSGADHGTDRGGGARA